MPRQKPNAPQRLGDEERQAQNWRMGEPQPEPETRRGIPPLLTLDDDDDSYNSEEDLDYIPPTSPTSVQTSTKTPVIRKKRGEKFTPKGEEIQDDFLKTLIAGARFFVPVKIIDPSKGEKEKKQIDVVATTSASVGKRKKYVSPSSEWRETLSLFTIGIAQNQEKVWPLAEIFSRDMNGEFWIYVSDVQELSFAYFEVCGQPDYIMLSELPSAGLLEGFISRGKSYLSLTYDPSQKYEPTHFNVAATVTESFLVKLVHPSDVTSKIPPSVRKALNHLFKSNSKILDFNDEDYDNGEGPVAKPDIDKLYETIKVYHESMGHTGTGGIDLVCDPQHRNLLPTLRPYQRNAVRWMLSKEMDTNDENITNAGKIHPLYEEIETLEGTKLYYNRVAGFLAREKPLAIKPPPGGILADEMGLGKTVEVLSLLLCHPRPNVPKPEWKEPDHIKKETRKKRKRVRSPSPVEFRIEELDVKNESEDLLIQLDGNQTSESEDNPDDEDFTLPSTSAATRKPAKKRVSFKANLSSDIEIEEDFDEMESSDPDEDDDDDYSPPSRRGGPSTSSTSSRKKKRKLYLESEEDSEEEMLVKRWKKAASKSSKPKTRQKSILKKETRKTKEKSAAAEVKEKFDPMSILKTKAISKSSKLSDLILYIVAKNQTEEKAVSATAIKKILDSEYKKSKNTSINNEIALLVMKGELLNTSGVRGSSGSFVVNPEFETFDSRRSYLSTKTPLSSVDLVIEDVITKYCYDGQPCSGEKTLAELEVERKQEEKRKLSRSGLVYDKLRKMYDQEMQEMSQAMALRDERRKKWNGMLFATKVEQCEYFECVCGSEADEDRDPKHRVQCSGCRLLQHSECVKYDVTDPYRGDYFCPHCWMEREPVESGATLIITPNTISHQWVDEIQKHIHNTNIRMLFYKGTKACGYLQPRTLAGYDLVITTYSVLQSETNYVDLPHTNSSEGRKFRNPKRFMAVPAPLPCINWWRICLDEAQMIENSTTKTAEMALRLKAINRWCVTGTPIGKSLNDIQGLLLFLQIDPYSMEFWWQRCLSRPYLRGHTLPLENVLSNLMWRTAKKDVLDQINIPKQTEEIHWLSFSPVEEHFYRRTFIDCSREMIEKLRSFSRVDIKLSEMDRKSLQVLLNPLLRLRQSCCHPQAVRGQFIKINKSTMTMEDLLEQMIKKSSLECEDSNRAYIASLNGLAGIDIIEEKLPDAVDKYREVLRFVDENKAKVKTDTLQRLHTVVNLTELLESKHEGIDPTLRDDQLKTEADKLRQKYLTKYSTALEAAEGTLLPASSSVETLRESFVCSASSDASQDEGSWYVQAIDQADSSANEANLMKLIHEEMAQFYDVVNDREFEQIKERYTSSRVVMYTIAEKIKEVDNMRNRVTKELSRLQKRSSNDFLNAAVDCHLRMSNAIQKNKKKCDLCTVHDDIELYEGILFHFVKGEIKAFKGKARQSISAAEQQRLEDAGVFLHEDQRKGTWADSEVERLLRAILKYSKQNGSYSSQEILDDGTTHMKLFEAMKKEFRLLRIFWRQIYDQVAALDELNMSVLRLRLRYDDEPLTALGAMKQRKKKNEADLATREKDKFETIYILEKHEVGSQRLKLISEKTIALNEFRKKFGQLLYLENLRNSEYGRDGGGENPEPCPICQKSLGTQWSVLQCGHCFCVECVKRLMDEFSVRGANRSSVKCAICRNLTFHSEISYVNTVREHETELDSRAYEAVKGSLSTKIEAVVKTLIRIQMLDPDAKSLVFSTWTDVLDILASALIENDIPFAALQDQGKFKRNLEKFKNRDDVKVLLLPVTSGANGLNLISASHVLLIEPILNPAQELQAIGRVHRIGQQKPTIVHRFLIKSTIEERMYNMLRTYQFDESVQGSHSTEENVITVKDLQHLFDDEAKS